MNVNIKMHKFSALWVTTSSSSSNLTGPFWFIALEFMIRFRFEYFVIKK